jgi:hypothetical protein
MMMIMKKMIIHQVNDHMAQHFNHWELRGVIAVITIVMVKKKLLQMIIILKVCF